MGGRKPLGAQRDGSALHVGWFDGLRALARDTGRVRNIKRLNGFSVACPFSAGSAADKRKSHHRGLHRTIAVGKLMLRVTSLAREKPE